MGIQAKNINQSFGEPATHVLHDISLDIKNGEFVSLIGKSGSGKSTLLYILSTLDQATSGDLHIDDININKLPTNKLHSFRNESVGFVFQFHYLLPELTVLENVLLPTLKTGTTKEHRKKAHELLTEFGIADKINRLPTQLSGGEQQRVAIARALIMSPKYLFADEPTGNLDSINGEIVLSLLERINKELGTTIIMVTHDPDFAARAKRQITLVDGRVE